MLFNLLNYVSIFIDKNKMNFKMKIYGKSYAKIWIGLPMSGNIIRKIEAACHQLTPSSLPAFFFPIALIHNWYCKYSIHLCVTCFLSLLECSTHEGRDIIYFHHLCIPRVKNNACSKQKQINENLKNFTIIFILKHYFLLEKQKIKAISILRKNFKCYLGRKQENEADVQAGRGGLVLLLWEMSPRWW